MGFFDFFKRKPKPSMKVSRTTVLNSEQGTAHWSDKDYRNFAEETYMKNIIAFRCIFYIASSVSSVKWGLYKYEGKKRVEIENHPILNLLTRANPDESFVFVMQRLISFLLISGNGYLEKVAPDGGVNKGIPREMYSLRPDKMTFDTDKDSGQITRYIYDQKIKFEVDFISRKSDILHLKMFHPLDEFFGLSVTEPVAREIDSSNEAINWQKCMFQNEGRPGLVLSYEEDLTDEQYDRIEKMLKEGYQGGANAGRNLILEGGGVKAVTPYAFSPKEMDWIESNRELSRRICNGYGVPPMLIGIPGDNTYSNQKEARAAFWEETVVYFLDFVSGEINNWLFEDNNTFISYDLSGVPAMAYRLETTWSRVKDANFLTIDEKREAVGYPALPNGMGNVILVAMGQVPLEDLLADDSSDTGTNEQDQQQQEEDEVQKLIEQGFDEKIARALVGATYE